MVWPRTHFANGSISTVRGAIETFSTRRRISSFSAAAMPSSRIPIAFLATAASSP